MKKIAILISGQIRIFEKNINFFNDLKKSLSDYEVTIVSSVWENQNEIELFKKRYNVKYINQVKEQDWSSLISKIKYVTWQENTLHGKKILDLKYLTFFICGAP